MTHEQRRAKWRMERNLHSIQLNLDLATMGHKLNHKRMLMYARQVETDLATLTRDMLFDDVALNGTSGEGNGD